MTARGRGRDGELVLNEYGFLFGRMQRFWKWMVVVVTHHCQWT